MTSLRTASTGTAPAIGAALRPFRTPVRGHAFAARPPGASAPHAGQPARLVREPANPADELAVGVWIDDGPGPWRIGYLDAAVVAWLAPELDRGLAVEARIDGWAAEPEGRWRRPVVLLLPGTAAQPSGAVGSGDRHSGGRAATSSRPVDRDSGTTAAPRPVGEDRQRSLWGRPPGVTVRPVGRQRSGTR